MSDRSEIAAKLQEYLNGAIQLRELRRWIVRCHIEVANHLKKVNAEDARLLSDVQGLYAEHSDSGLSESQWREHLNELLFASQQFPYSVSRSVVSGSSNTALQPNRWDWAADRAASSIQFGDRQFSSVC
jgi:hypothetical protein